MAPDCLALALPSFLRFFAALYTATRRFFAPDMHMYTRGSLLSSLFSILSLLASAPFLQPVRSKQPMDHKRIFLFTNDDNPLKGDADETKKVHMIAMVCMVLYHRYHTTLKYVRIVS